MIEDMEADFAGAPKYTSNTDDVTLAEVKHSDEAITAEANASNDMENYLKEERKTKSYKEIITIDIEYMNTI